jgi:NTP pyrophosphatase (non-canonical NTP hydrolase)
MENKNYVKEVLRTESTDLNPIKNRLSEDDTIRLLHAGMGLVTESAEFLDMLKKHIFYGKPIDIINAKEEVGDNLWYAAVAIDVLKTTFDEVMGGNIEKLRKRYPEKFTEENAINRNVENELSHIKE